MPEEDEVVRALRRVAGLALSALALCACGAPASVPPRLLGTPALSINVPLQVVACTGLGDCVAAGANGTSLAPTTTAQRRAPNGSWSPLAAPSVSDATLVTQSCGRDRCLLGGGTNGSDLLWGFTSGTLESVTPPPGGSGVGALSCANSSWCALLDSSPSGWRLSSASDVGARWSAPQPVPALTGTVVVLSCPVAGVCVAGDGSGHLVETLTSGRTWIRPATPLTWTSILGLQCWSSTHCLVLAQEAGGPVIQATSGLGPATSSSTTAPTTTTTSSGGWSSPVTSTGARTVACVSETSCVLSGDDALHEGSVQWWHHGTLANARLSYVPDPLTALTCLETLCVAAGGTTVLAWRP